MIQWPHDDGELLKPRETWLLLSVIAGGLVLWIAPGLIVGYLIWG